MRCFSSTKIFPIFHNRPSTVFTATLHTSICFSSSSSSSSSLILKKPQTPLFLRPLTHSTTLSDLKKWHEWARSLASSVGSTFVHLDNGPDSTLLLRELNWLVEDCCELGTRSLSNTACISSSRSTVVKLRVDIDELYTLWRQRIEERRPFQYIVGCEHWRDLVLSVEEGVLIPRPETELIVDLVSDFALNDGDKQLKDGLWADLGTGSGAIAIAIGKILQKHGTGRVIATDLSPVAVSVAAFNVRRYDLQDIVEVRQGSWFQPLKHIEGKLAGLVSNPPYIPSNQILGLQAEVGRHEPRLALDGGVDGMDDLLHLCNGAASLLKPGGFFAFETNGERQSKCLAEYVDKYVEGSFWNVNIVSDLAGVRRFVTGFHQ